MTGLKDFIKSNSFQFGSKNYDDDFHTDVLFYRASCSHIADYIGDCHQVMIAFHKDFTSTFYYPEEQTKKLCQRILFLLENDDDFLFGFENLYKTSCEKLASCCDEQHLSPLDYYQKQYQCQQEMYKYCWPFEILQTPHGIEQAIVCALKAQGFDDKTVSDILYQNEIVNDNVYFQEKAEIEAICQYITSQPDLLKIFQRSLKHIIMLIPAQLRSKIDAVVERYKYLYYHGFSDRKLPNLYDYLVKIKQQLRTPMRLDESNTTTFYNIDAKTKRLLFCYKKLSALKSIRRLAQLKNFYHLDVFVRTLADMHGVAESTIRCMTPEEVVDFYKSGKYDTSIDERINGMVYICQNGCEQIVCEQDIAYYQNLLSCNENFAKDVFCGKVACRGYAKGRVVKLVRPDDSQNITKDCIILTHEGDPDLLPQIKQAGAVVCEQAGITCHMAVIAREYGIPCLIGIGNNVIDSFENGDYVEVDAINGMLKRSIV